MQSTAFTYVPSQVERRVSLSKKRRISLSKISVILASFALWAALIGGVAMAVG